MKRLERLGSVAFITVLISLTFHLIAMSFNRWKIITCHGCDDKDILASWNTGLTQRCYATSMASIFDPTENSSSNSIPNTFRAEVCITHKFLMIKNIQKSSYCLQTNIQNGDIVCTNQDYDKNACLCDYSPRTKLILAMTILTALSLGVLIFLSHLVAFVKIDYVIKWLIPICYSLLIFAIVCMLVTLITAGSNLDEDINELRYSYSLLDTTYFNETTVDKRREQLKTSRVERYSTKVGWCFGLEFLAFHFSLVSAVLYLIMFLVKRRPNAIKFIR